MENLEQGALPERLWDLKPWWCQPWSILITGLVIPVLSWLLWKQLWLSTVVVIGVVGWWWLFLVQAPRSWKQLIREKQNVTAVESER